MSLKLFGQLLVIGCQVIGKVASGAYKQAVANMAKNPKHSKDAAVTSSSMTFDEASKILNCPKNPTKEELLQKFEHLFKVNDRKAGGSFYLQSKVVRAREALETQLKKQSEESLANMKKKNPNSPNSS